MDVPVGERQLPPDIAPWSHHLTISRDHVHRGCCPEGKHGGAPIQDEGADRHGRRMSADVGRFTKVERNGPSRHTATRAYHQSTFTRLSDHTSEHFLSPTQTPVDSTPTLAALYSRVRPWLGQSWGRSAGDWRGIGFPSFPPLPHWTLGVEDYCRLRTAAFPRVIIVLYR